MPFCPHLFACKDLLQCLLDLVGGLLTGTSRLFCCCSESRKPCGFGSVEAAPLCPPAVYQWGRCWGRSKSWMGLRDIWAGQSAALLPSGPVHGQSPHLPLPVTRASSILLPRTGVAAGEGHGFSTCHSWQGIREEDISLLSMPPRSKQEAGWALLLSHPFGQPPPKSDSDLLCCPDEEQTRAALPSVHSVERVGGDLSLACATTQQTRGRQASSCGRFFVWLLIISLSSLKKYLFSFFSHLLGPLLLLRS